MNSRLPTPLYPLLLVLLVLAAVANPAVAERPKAALVIGNADYEISELTNPVNDATDIAAKLESFGFHVTLLRNANQKQMEDAVLAFGKRLARDENTVGLFYFAGHGIEVARQNYLIPVQVDLRSESDVKYKAMNAGWLLDSMMNAGNTLNLVVLDACRNNPFARSMRSAGRGLADMNPARGTMVFYATEPGKVARDGDGRNGVFTEHLLRSMDVPGLSVDQVFNRTATNVDAFTEGEQTPWKEGVVLGIFSFNEAPLAATPSPSAASASAPPPVPLAVTGQLQINVNTPDSQVTVNGIPRGTTGPGKPLNITGLAVGSATIRVEAPGHQSASKSVNLQAGQWIQEVFWLQPLHSGPAKLTVRSNVYGDRVSIDGREYGSTRLDVDLPPGRHTIQVNKDGHNSWQQSIELAAGEQRTLHAQLTPMVASIPAAAPTAARKSTRAAPAGDPTQPKLVRVEGGCFQMGSPEDEEERDDDEARHEVCLGSFSIGAHEVTQTQWQAIMGSNPSGFTDDPSCPVENVSWLDIQNYLEALNQKTGKQYRLPTEAEWEYAARAGRTGPFSFRGMLHTGKVNYNGTFTYGGSPKGEYRQKTLPAGSMPPNRWGLTEVHGNIREWTCSAYTRQYQGLESECAANDAEGQRTIRGGSWLNIPRYARSANRYGEDPGFTATTIGFRLAHD